MLDRTKDNSSSLDFRIDEVASTGVMKIEGPLTEQSVNEVRKTLEASAGKVNYFKLNLENVTAVDLSSIRLLFSTSETLGKSNKPLTIDGICPVVFTSAVEDMGFSDRKWLCFGQ